MYFLPNMSVFVYNFISWGFDKSVDNQLSNPWYSTSLLTLDGTDVRVANLSGSPVLLRSKKGTNRLLCRVWLTNRTECNRANPFSTLVTALGDSPDPSSGTNFPLPVLLWVGSFWRICFFVLADCPLWRSCLQLAWVILRMWIRELVTFTHSCSGAKGVRGGVRSDIMTSVTVYCTLWDNISWRHEELALLKFCGFYSLLVTIVSSITGCYTCHIATQV